MHSPVIDDVASILKTSEATLDDIVLTYQADSRCVPPSPLPERLHLLARAACNVVETAVASIGILTRHDTELPGEPPALDEMNALYGSAILGDHHRGLSRTTKQLGTAAIRLREAASRLASSLSAPASRSRVLTDILLLHSHIALARNMLANLITFPTPRSLGKSLLAARTVVESQDWSISPASEAEHSPVGTTRARPTIPRRPRRLARIFNAARPPRE